MPEAAGANSDDSRHYLIRELRQRRNVEENFRNLFQLYHRAVWSYFSRKGFSPEDCRDLAQEVFVAVYMGLDGLRSEEAFTGWLFSIARNVSFRQMERQGPPAGRAEAGARDDVEAEVAAPETDALARMIHREKSDAMRAALEELPVREQECIRGRLVDELNYRQIGERLGISENTVAVHIHRGVKNLRARLKLLFGDAPFAGDI